MNEIKSGDRVRVVRDLYSETYPITDMVGEEGAVTKVGSDLHWSGDDHTDFRQSRDSEPTWVRVTLKSGVIELFHPDELEVIEP